MSDQSTSINQKVHTFATNKAAQQVGSGECFDLADQALKDAGAKSAADYGKVTADADYKWGKSVPLADAQAGDVLQFRNYKVTIVTVTKTTKTFKDGSTEESDSTYTETYGRPHHTAIVSKKPASGQLEVMEQNAPPRGSSTNDRVVRTNVLDTAGSSTTTTSVRLESDGRVKTDTTITITVTGTISAYRPEAK